MHFFHLVLISGLGYCRSCSDHRAKETTSFQHIFIPLLVLPIHFNQLISQKLLQEKLPQIGRLLLFIYFKRLNSFITSLRLKVNLDIDDQMASFIGSSLIVIINLVLYGFFNSSHKQVSTFECHWFGSNKCIIININHFEEKPKPWKDSFGLVKAHVRLDESVRYRYLDRVKTKFWLVFTLFQVWFIWDT